MSSINWTGNKVFDPAAVRQQPRAAAQSAPPVKSPPASPVTPAAQAAQATQAAQPKAVQSAPSVYTPPAGQAAGVYSDLSPTPAPAPISFSDDATGSVQGPPPSTEPGFIPYYLSSNIGRNVRCEFVIGTNQYVDKAGMLSEVGINYFVLRDINSRTDIMCDLYSVKFVTVLRG